MDAKTTKPTLVSPSIVKPFPKQGLSDHVRAAPQPPGPRPSREQAEEAVRTLLSYAGDGPKRRHGIDDPRRD